MTFASTQRLTDTSAPYVQSVDYRSPTSFFEIAESLHHTGFAVLKNHPVSQKLLKDVLEEWKAFFARTDKERYLYDSTYLAGYYPVGSENSKGAYQKNIMEYFHHYVAFDLPDGMSQKSNDLYWQLADLSKDILRGLEEALPEKIKKTLPESLVDMASFHEPHTLMRAIHYPPMSKDDIDLKRNMEHEDINLITLLCSATSPGLQVKDAQGYWHDVGYGTEDIVINIADMLQVLTDGYYTSTTHRVVTLNKSDLETSRFSIPLFIHPRRDVELKKGFTANDFLTQRLHETGILADDDKEESV